MLTDDAGAVLEAIRARADAATEEEQREAARIAEAKAEYERRRWYQPQRWDWLENVTARTEFQRHAREDVPRLLAAVDAVLGLHQRADYGLGTTVGCTVCGAPMRTHSNPNPEPGWPCPTVAAITEALTRKEEA